MQLPLRQGLDVPRRWTRKGVTSAAGSPSSDTFRPSTFTVPGMLGRNLGGLGFRVYGLWFRVWGFKNFGGTLIGVLVIRESYYFGGYIRGPDSLNFRKPPFLWRSTLNQPFGFRSLVCLEGFFGP